MTSPENTLEEVSNKLNDVSQKMQQLLERKKVLCIMHELRSRVGIRGTDEADSSQQELDSIDEKLKLLEERRAELQQQHDYLLNTDNIKTQKKVSFSADEKPHSEVSGSSPQIFFVEAPPLDPAPAVVLDLDQLPPKPCKTQCPECMAYITTETFTSVSSVTWLVCLMSAMIGCVAGCCLIPFCLDTFKTTTHRCPKCKKPLRSLKKL